MIKKLLIAAAISVCFSAANAQPCQIIEYNVSCSVEGPKLTEEKQVVLQINNREGEQFSSVTINYSKNDKLSNIEGGILDRHGNLVRKLKSGEITTSSAISNISLYEDDFIKKFDLKYNSFPYRIFYSYRITYGDFIEIANWTPFLNPEISCEKATLKVSVPQGYPIRYNQQGLELSIDTLEKTIDYKWTGTYSDIYSPVVY